MDILKKIEQVKARHNQINQELEQLQQRANTLVDEVKRLQGEFRLLVELGQAEGLLDEEGNPLPKEKSASEKSETPKKAASAKKKGN